MKRLYSPQCRFSKCLTLSQILKLCNSDFFFFLKLIHEHVFRPQKPSHPSLSHMFTLTEEKTVDLFSQRRRYFIEMPKHAGSFDWLCIFLGITLNVICRSDAAACLRRFPAADSYDLQLVFLYFKSKEAERICSSHTKFPPSVILVERYTDISADFSLKGQRVTFSSTLWLKKAHCKQINTCVYFSCALIGDFHLVKVKPRADPRSGLQQIRGGAIRS